MEAANRGAPGSWRQDYRPEYQPSPKQKAEPIYHARAELRISLLLYHAPILVCVSHKAYGHVPWKFRHLDELTEILTLVQTQKLVKKIVVVLYGTTFWKEILNFDALVRHGVIDKKDLELFQFADDVDTAFKLLQDGLTKFYLEPETELPVIAKSRV